MPSVLHAESRGCVNREEVLIKLSRSELGGWSLLRIVFAVVFVDTVFDTVFDTAAISLDTVGFL